MAKFDIGTVVKITDHNKNWDDYIETVGCVGIIRGKKSSKGNYPVEIDGLKNRKPSFIQKYDGLFWIHEDYLVEVEKGQGETIMKNNENNYRTCEIIKIYETNLRDKNKQVYEKLVSEELKTDGFYKDIQSHLIAINSLLNCIHQEETVNLKHPIETYMSEDTKQTLRMFKKDLDIENFKIVKTIQEIESQLKACDTYEQEINILKIYGVLDEEGKISTL